MHLKKKCKIIYSYLARAFNTIIIHSILLHNFHKFGIEGLALAISKKQETMNSSKKFQKSGNTGTMWSF